MRLSSSPRKSLSGDETLLLLAAETLLLLAAEEGNSGKLTASTASIIYQKSIQSFYAAAPSAIGREDA